MEKIILKTNRETIHGALPSVADPSVADSEREFSCSGFLVWTSLARLIWVFREIIPDGAPPGSMGAFRRTFLESRVFNDAESIVLVCDENLFQIVLDRKLIQISGYNEFLASELSSEGFFHSSQETIAENHVRVTVTNHFRGVGSVECQIWELAS